MRDFARVGGDGAGTTRAKGYTVSDPATQVSLDPTLKAYRRIIAGIDFSDESEHAMSAAIAVARRSGAEVIAAHSISLHDTIERADDDPAADYGTLAAAEDHTSRDRLTELRSRFRGSGIETSQVLLEGFAGPALQRAAADFDAQLVVVGTHGYRGLRRLLLGSVAIDLIRGASTDVLIARAPAPERLERILVPTDLGDHARRAVDRAAGLVCAGGRIDLHHSWQPPTPTVYRSINPSDPRFRSLESAVKKNAVEWARPILRDYAKSDFEIGVSAGLGIPAEEIPIQANGYELVVMTSARRRGIRRLLGGSVAEEVARRAPCSVLVVQQTPRQRGNR